MEEQRMPMKKVAWVRPAILVGGLLVLAGCGGSGPKLVPVSGTVTLDGQPLTRCSVALIPDTAKGNKGSLSCMGAVNAQGQFTIKTFGVKPSEGGMGAPLGWYKVTLRTGPGQPDLNVDPKFLDPAATPWSVEVIDNPPADHYDFKATK
jgi:hypothetical protein